MRGLTEALAEFIHDKTAQDFPPAVLDKAKKALADTFAVILAGAGSEVAPPLMRYVEQASEGGASLILGSGRMAAPEMVALVNGTFGHALDFDDVLSVMPAHPSAVILPALFAAYGVEESAPEAALNQLGHPWVIVDPGLALKQFPCCYASHRGMDGVLQLRQRLGFVAADLARLECRMPPGGMRVLIYPQPKTGLEGKFSLQYSLAAGVLDGQYTLWSFTDEAVNRVSVRDLLERVFVTEEPRCAGDDPLLETRSSGSRGFVEVEATLADGRRGTVRVHQAPGHPSRELTWEDMAAKFSDCAAQAHLDPVKATSALRLLERLETCTDMREVVALLH
jgi:2-methylcitrate dehydratase PrpD